MQPELGDNVELVLLDENGGKIHASDRGTLWIKDQLVEDVVYEFSNFGVSLNTQIYKPIRHVYKLTFNLRTTLTLVPTSTIPMYGFSFVDFDDIINETKEVAYLVGLVGISNTKFSSQLFINAELYEKISCVTVATIKEIQSNLNWWYKGCKGRVQRFCIQIRVVVETGVASFVIFEKEVMNILKISAPDLCELHLKRDACDIRNSYVDNEQPSDDDSLKLLRSYAEVEENGNADEEGELSSTKLKLQLINIKVTKRLMVE
ncbi:hypothetical protein Ddye_012053 [Dipteronia dyeriana]|uniref:Replication protein A 70 kDa DNA-binding subunit B/D first OB fold domain-containing protein n=1 Tax=Dipteronia dyeriana TaxID=168575 RepID=A0AAE0CI46_9ROSI|nr:hypothetical protein Ddye_012053 [Dipteronia dyeriana]